MVVKPYDGNHGRGVFTNLTTREEVLSAYAVAVEEGSGVIVERFVLGNEHRLLVVGDRMVAAAAGEPAWVTGDGKSSITELIDNQINTDPRRGRTNHPLNPVRLDSAARLEIARQGMDADSVPADGQRVLVQRSGNVAFDVTDKVHPSVAATVTLAARIVGLDIAGVDLVAEDISRPLDEQRGAIVEVNAGPGLLMHLKPADGTPAPWAGPSSTTCSPKATPAASPSSASPAPTARPWSRLIARLLYLSGKRTGLACSEGLYLDRRLVQKGDRADFASGTRVLMNRNVDAAVIENDSSVILGQGLAYDRCQVGVVTNIDDADHLGDFDINDAERMFNVFRTQVDVVLPGGYTVLNARDPRVVEMAELSDGAVIFFGIDPALPAIAAHLQQDGRAVFVRDGAIVLAQGPRQERLADVAAIPLTHGGRVAFQVENVLAAVGAAWALDIPVELIRAGIETFDIDQADAPWQFTLFERGGSTVVVDDAHNASALRPLIAAIDQFPATARCAVYSAGADRHDADLIEQGKLLGDAFDRVVLYDDATVRSKRPEGQARALLRQGLAQGSRVKHIEDEPDHGKAIAGALDAIATGDFVPAVGRSLLRPHHRSGPPLDPATLTPPRRALIGARALNRQEYLPWKFPASERCAAPICGARTRRSRPSCPAPTPSAPSTTSPTSRRGCAPPAADRPAAPRGPPGRRLHRPRAADRLADHAGPRRLPGHVRSHLDHDRTGCVPGGGRVQRGRSRPPGDGARPAAGARRAGRHALRPADALKRLRELDEDVRLGPSTSSIVNAATARGIPYRRLTQGSMVQFGWGSKQRRIQAAGPT